MSTYRLTAALGLLGICLVLTACFFDDKGGASDPAKLDNLYAYQSSSPYADVLVDCVRVKSPSGSCALVTLPTLGLATETPTIDHVMDRVVVSHDWMGLRFEQLLQEMPNDMLLLLRGVTAVVIGSNVRPSFYWNMTGAIYLDPGRLWLTEAERDTVSKDPDHRQAYADPMAFRAFWRWVSDDWAWYGTGNNGIRPITDIVPDMAALLFHELAHANDLLPPSAYQSINLADSIYAASNKLSAQYPSTQLKNNTPLTSEQMFRLAGILYKGAQPSDTDTQITAAQVGVLFEPDIASDNYSYTTQYEDMAMLFEEAMMKLHFDFDRDLAFVTPSDDPQTCDDYAVSWGVRNRLGDVNVLPRAQFVVDALLPDADFNEQFENFPLPTALPQIGWCASKMMGPLFEKSNYIPSPEPQPLNPDHHTRPYRIFHGPE